VQGGGHLPGVDPLLAYHRRVTDHSTTRSTASTLLGGRYALRGEVGRGGMATVHRARDEVLDRDVAVKVLHAHLAGDETFLDRFRREARAAAAVHHPNVVTVHDWGETDQGAFLVLQYVEGCSLREVLRRRRRLSPAETLAVLGPAGEGLGAAHSAGLVHRDVKPENLLLASEGEVRITDFGLARAAASATSTFGADVLVGSPHYLSPEAVRGEPLTPAADVYALGVVLFECLTGRPPHEGDSPFATAVAHTAGRVPAPSSLVDGVPPEVDRVVVTATHHDPDRRYADGAAFAAALRAAVPAGPAAVPTPTDGRVSPADHTETVVSDRHAAGTRTVSPGWADVDDDLDDVEDDADDEEPGSGRRRGRRRVWLALLLVLGLLAASAAGGYLLWDRVLAPVTPIPPVTGAEQAAAVAQLERAGFEVDVAAERPHDLEVAEGHVLEQSPTGEARQGEVITLTLSGGPRQVDVPDVEGEPRARAVELLEEAGLEVTATQQHDEQVAEGVVLSQAPGADAVVDETSTVEITVSLGPRPIEVPDLTGTRAGEAASQLEELGLQLEVGERRHHESAPKGEVLSQDAEAGSTLVRGQTVEVVVSDGPKPVEVPNVRNEQVEDAVEQLEALGFEVEVERRGGLGALFNPGRVVDQNPGPGSTRLPGDTVTVYAYED
jgi:eukaryotic-like serine/threonine-protein kinase